MTLINENIPLELAYNFRGSVHYFQSGSMAVSRQAWEWKSREFYILIQRQPGEDYLLQADKRRKRKRRRRLSPTLGRAWALEVHKAHLHSDTLPPMPQLLNSATSHGTKHIETTVLCFLPLGCWDFRHVPSYPVLYNGSCWVIIIDIASPGKILMSQQLERLR